jgi:cell wall-associated NlpC family hydrolase
MMQHRGQSKAQWSAVLAVTSVLLFQSASARADSPVAGSEVVVHALALVDVPYRYGGRTPAGFDCSGFVGYVFSESLGLALPRRAEDISRIGRTREKADLTPGDLVFFNTLGHRFSHVGIYVGDGQFVHAPARRGRVRIERLGDPYWTARYNGARRVDGGGPAPATSPTAYSVFGAGGDAATDQRITP